jgi:hypothetical protein
MNARNLASRLGLVATVAALAAMLGGCAESSIHGRAGYPAVEERTTDKMLRVGQNSPAHIEEMQVAKSEPVNVEHTQHSRAGKTLLMPH